MDLTAVQSKIRSLIPSSLQGQLQSLMKSKSAGPVEPVIRLACDLGKSKIAMMEMEKSSDGFSISRFCKMPRPKEEIELIQLLQQTFQQQAFRTDKVRISLKGQGVVVRFVQFPMMTDEELRGAITFEAEKYIPFKADEVVLDYHVIEPQMETSNGKMMNVLLVAVKKEEIYPILNIYKNAGLTVELIDIDSLAFMNAIEYVYPDEVKSSVGILDVGSEITTLGILKNGKPQFIRDISYGGTDLVKRLKRKLGMTVEQAIEALEVDRKPAEAAQKEIVDGLSPLIADLRVSLDYFLDQVHMSDSLEKVFLSGGAGYHPLVCDTLSKELGVQVGTLDILAKIKTAEHVDIELVKKNSSLLPIALGLCVRDL